MKKKATGNRFWMWVRRIFLALFCFHLFYIVILKWVNPPITLTQLGSLFGGEGLKRDYVDNEDLPYAMKLAVIASEDQKFAVHSGFDWKSIDKAVKHNEKKPKKVRGASSISQQVAKNVFLWQGSGVARYLRKIPEAYYTLMIELIWGKERILEVYLNIAEMGPGIFGIEAASQAYFKKPAISLNRQEAAMIISCLPSPKRYTVKPVSGWVRWRHPRVMNQMRYIESDPDVQILMYGKKEVVNK